MKQYEFQAINKSNPNRVEHIRATAKNEAIARAHIVNYYGTQFDVLQACCNVYKPHQVLGEIDCSGDTDNGEYIFALIAKKGFI
jgi:hypothetical protein